MTVLLMNLLPVLIIAITLGFVWKYRKNYKRVGLIVLGMLAALALLAFLQPSYMPKGTAPDMEVPAYQEGEEIVVQDRMLKGMDQQERAEHFDSLFDFKDKVKVVSPDAKPEVKVEAPLTPAEVKSELPVENS